MIKMLINKLIGSAKPKRASNGYREFVFEFLPKNAVGVEIGVHKGNFSASILNALTPRELHLIDPWKYEDSEPYKHALYGGRASNGQLELDKRYESVKQRFNENILAGRVIIHRGPSSSVMPEFPDAYFDWVYIDGNHLYEFVKADLQISYEKIKPGGLITGDDYHDGAWWQGGVKKAVDEFIAQKKSKVLSLENGQFILQR
jgi:hypothetical protein